MLASLEQYILLNSSDFHCRASHSVTIELLVNLYGLYRGFAKMSYQIPYSAEAERILFHLLAEYDWDSLSKRIHPMSLKWMFQQEQLCKPLSVQMLNICRSNSSNDNLSGLGYKMTQAVDLNAFAELIASGDNLVAVIFVRLLGDLLESDSQNQDAISVVTALMKIVEIAPVTSDQFCIHGIETVLQRIYNHSRYCFPELLASTSDLVLTILRTVQPESISNSEAWTGMTMTV